MKRGSAWRQGWREGEREDDRDARDQAPRPKLDANVQLWSDAFDKSRGALKTYMAGKDVTRGGDRGNMSLIMHKTNQRSEVSFVHWRFPDKDMGQVVHTDTNDRMKSLVP